MDCSTPGFSVHHQHPEFVQIHVHRVGEAIQSSHPLSVPFSSHLQSFPASGSFPMSQFFTSGGQSIGFNFSISPFNEYSGLISFRMDWLDLLEVQRTLKSLLQHHSTNSHHNSAPIQHHRHSKAPVLLCSAFFMVQLSHPHMTTGMACCSTWGHKESDTTEQLNWTELNCQLRS